MTRHRRRLAGAGMLATSLLSSCATLVHGPYQQLTVTSTPPGAEIRVLDATTRERIRRRVVTKIEEAETGLGGVTPCTIRLKRLPGGLGSRHLFYAVHADKTGYAPRMAAVF